MVRFDHFPAPRLPRPHTDPGENSAAQLIAVALAAVLTVADYLTDPYLAFSTFYLVPVVVMAWYATRLRAIAFCVLVATGGVVARILDPESVRPGINIANGVLRLIMFVFAVLLVEAECRARLRVLLLSTTDSLTGMLNRRAFEDLGRDRLALAAREQSPVTLVYIDLDDLKSRNDEYGHDAGDRLIVSFAEAMTDTFRTSDLLTRMGGDEFCCLLSNTDEDQAVAGLERFTAALARIRPHPVQASMGAVTTVPRPDTRIMDLIHEADALMYTAKLTGKGQHRTRTIDPPDLRRPGSEPTPRQHPHSS